MRARWAIDPAGRFTTNEILGTLTVKRDLPCGIAGVLRAVVHPDDHGRILGSLVAARSERRRVHETVAVRCLDGRYRWAEAEVWPEGDGLAGEFEVAADFPRFTLGLIAAAYN